MRAVALAREVSQKQESEQQHDSSEDAELQRTHEADTRSARQIAGFRLLAHFGTWVSALRREPRTQAIGFLEIWSAILPSQVNREDLGDYRAEIEELAAGGAVAP